jgi:hypothetical protein
LRLHFEKLLELNSVRVISSLAHIQLTAAEQALCILDAAVWGRPEIERLMLFWKYEVKLHLIEKLGASGRDISCHLIES